MDYEIAFDESENCYRVITSYEFSAIADWVSECLQKREDIQKVLQTIHLVETETEASILEHGVYSINIGTEGVTVTRKVDMSDAREEIKAVFDTQSDFYQTSEDGVKSECGLDDVITLLENWHNVLY